MFETETINKFSLKKNIYISANICIFLGLIGLIIGFFTASQHNYIRLWSTLLVSNIYVVTICVGSLVFLSIQYITNSGWSTILNGIICSIGRLVPYSMFSLFLLLFLSVDILYHHWIHPDSIVIKKTAYLNKNFFLLRTFIYLLVWSSYIYIMNYKVDIKKSSYYYQRLVSIIYIALFCITISFAGIDWIKSINPHWVNTMFGVYFFAGILNKAIVFITLVTLLVYKENIIKELNSIHLYNLGKYIFGTSTFWCYIWYFQVMLIWYANIPEETLWYKNQLNSYLFYINPILNWVLPFLLLINKKMKSNFYILLFVCFILVVGHWCDLFLMIVYANTEHIGIHLYDILVFLGFLGLFLYAIAFLIYNSSSLIARDNPFIKESINITD